MATVLQTAKGSGASSSSATFTNPTTPGSTIVAVACTYGASPAVSDLVNGSYTVLRAADHSVADSSYVSSWYFPNAASISTVSLTGGAGVFAGLIILEVAGLGASPTVDNAGAFNGTNSTVNWTSGLMSPSSANTFQVAYGGSVQASGVNFSQVSPFTMQLVNSTTGEIFCETQTASANTPITAGATAAVNIGSGGMAVAALTAPSPGYNVSGQILDGSSNPVSGVTIAWTGTASGSTTTDGSGNWTAATLANGSYTFTPTKTGWTFAPTSRAETVSGAAITGVNFTGTQSLTATPVLSPGTESFHGAVAVSISCSTPSSTIYYTTDGSTPTTGSTVYSGPIPVTATTTVKALATASGYANSAVGSATYTYQAPTYTQLASDPLNVNGSLSANWTTYGDAFIVPCIINNNQCQDSVITGNGGARWTASTFPSGTNIGQYAQATIAAIEASGEVQVLVYSASSLGTASYSIDVLRDPSGSGATLQIYKQAHTSLASTTVTLLGNDVIRVEVYNSVVVVYFNGAKTLQVVDTSYTSGQPGLEVIPNTDVTLTGVTTFTAGEILLGTVATPTFSPVAGTYTSAQTVTISSTDSGLSGFAMYYTTDGSTPTTGSTLYTGPVTVSSSLTLKAIAVATSYANSNVGSAAYTINLGHSVSGSLGSAGAGATVSYSGQASGSVTADGSGNYTISNLSDGTYTITPTLTNITFVPTSKSVTVSGANISGANFSSSKYYSVPDCRVTKPNSATGEINQGTILYDSQTSSNSAIPPTDSRAAGAPTDSRANIPTNSRTPGTYGPGE